MLNELINKLNELERAHTMLSFKDRWTQDDYRRNNELFKEILATEKAIKELKGE